MRVSTASLPTLITTAAPFPEENVGNQEDTTFRRTEGGRNGTQEMKVWAPGLKQLRDRDRTILQDILDLTDWWGLHMTVTVQ